MSLNNINTTYYVSCHGFIPVQTVGNKNSPPNTLKKVPRMVHLWMQSQIGCLLQDSGNRLIKVFANIENIIKSKSIKNKRLNTTIFLSPGELYADTVLILKRPAANVFPVGVFKRTIRNQKLSKVNVSPISNKLTKGYEYVLLSDLLKHLREKSNGGFVISVSACREFKKKPRSLLISNNNIRDIQNIQNMIRMLTNDIPTSGVMPTSTQARKLLMLDNNNISKINLDNLIELFRTKKGITNKRALLMVLMDKLKYITINKKGTGLIHFNKQKSYVKQPCLFQSNCIKQRDLNRLQTINKLEKLMSSSYKRTHFN